MDHPGHVRVPTWLVVTAVIYAATASFVLTLVCARECGMASDVAAGPGAVGVAMTAAAVVVGCLAPTALATVRHGRSPE
ncbi:hypothetical protein [Williamsia deligens]|uniref:hypothetical protein n=1 Tax=Williamsia deligens TaxID=321325 RepID=UPI0031E2148D